MGWRWLMKSAAAGCGDVLRLRPTFCKPSFACLALGGRSLMPNASMGHGIVSTFPDPQLGVRFAPQVHDDNTSCDQCDPNHLAGAQELSVSQGSNQHHGEGADPAP